MAPEADFYDIPVEKVMNCNPPLIEEDASIREVAQKVCTATHVWVVEGKESRKIIGMITEKDLLDVVSPLPLKSYTVGVIMPKSLYHTEFKKAGDIMTELVSECHPKKTIEEALRLMAKHRVRRLAVTENGEIVGELTLNILIAVYFSLGDDL